MIVLQARSNLNIFIFFDKSVKVVSYKHEILSSTEIVISDDFNDFSVFRKELILENFEFKRLNKLH